MTNLYKKIRQFFEEDFSGLPTLVIVETPTRARVEFRSSIVPAPHLADYAPRLKVSGGVLHNPLLTPQTLEFSIEYPNPIQPEPNLIVDVYTSTDGTTYSLEATTPYDSLPITVTTDKEYVLGVIRTNDATPKILYSTKDWERGLRPLDVRVNEVDLVSYSYSGNTLKGTFPVFFDTNTNTLVVDFSYRGTESFSDSNLSYTSGDSINIKSWDDTLSQMVLVGTYYLGTFTLPKENLFPVGSPKLINGDVVTRTVDLKTLVDTLILLASLKDIDSFFESELLYLWSSFTGLVKDGTTGLFFEKYGIDGTPATQVVNIADNAYLALRFLSSGHQDFIDFVTVQSGGQTFLDKLGDVVSIPDGYVLYDSFDGSVYENSFRGFTEGIFYLLERLVETEYPSLVPTSFDSAQTLSTIVTYVDTAGSVTYCSKKERDGDPTAPERNSLDLAGLYTAINSVPITPTEDYSLQAGIIKTELLSYKVTNLVGILTVTDPNNPNYNPYWPSSPPIVGFKNKNSEVEIDTKVSLLVQNLTNDVVLRTDLGDMNTDDGVLYVDKANTAEEKYIVPNLHSTVLYVLSSLSSNFIKSTTYTVQVLDNLPNNASVVQTPTNQGVTLDITLDYPSGVVVLVVGDSSGTTFDSVIITNEVVQHTVYVKVPPVSENVKLYVLPIRPTQVT